MKKITSIHDLANMTSNSKSAEILWNCEEQGKMSELWDYILYNMPCDKMVDVLVDNFLASCKEEIWEALDLSQKREEEKRRRKEFDRL